MIDAHAHLNLKTAAPWADFKERMIRDGVDGSVLILNTPEEQQLALEQGQKLCEEGRVRFAACLDHRQPDPLAFVHTVREKRIPLTIGKLHPRVTDIRREEFSALVPLLERADFKTVIVDCFVYGHQIENHVGMELGIYLAQRFPEINFVLAHSGGCRLLETMLCTRTLSNIYYDYSLSCCYLWNTSIWQDMVQMLKFNSHRIMFGSDYPDFTPAQAKEKILLLAKQAELTPEQTERVLDKNAYALYWAE